MYNQAILYEYFYVAYADDIILLAPSVSALQRLLHVCEHQLNWLDMSINCLYFCPILAYFCLNLVVMATPFAPL